MRSLITYTAIAALTALPFIAEAQGKGNNNGNGNGNKSHASQGNGGGHENGGGNGNGRGKGPKHGEASQRDGNHGNGNNRAQANKGQADLAQIAAGLAAINGVIYLTPDVDFATISDADLAGFANCPPGLAKKNPPCVPPGLAKQGVTYDEWAGYNSDALRGVFNDGWTAFEPDDVERQPTNLTQAEISEIFGLPAALYGQRYAVIDGRPVLLSADDYDKLITINSLATRPTFDGNVPIATEAVLTQDQLIARYGLPELTAGQNYSVLDNQLIMLPDKSYDLLQLIRILGAV
jgi:hypothetical protein